MQVLVKIEPSVRGPTHKRTLSRHLYVRGYGSLRSLFQLHTHFRERELMLFVALVLFDLATLVCRGTRRDGTPGVLRSCSPLIRATPCYLLYTRHPALPPVSVSRSSQSRHKCRVVTSVAPRVLWLMILTYNTASYVLHCHCEYVRPAL